MTKLNRIIALATVTLLAISMFAAIASADWDGNPVAVHPIAVDLTGNIDLVWWSTTMTIPVAQNFTAIAPITIIPGQYDAKFYGWAHIDQFDISFNGMIMTDNGTFSAAFEVLNPGNLSSPELGGECAAWGNVTIVVSNITLPPPPVFRYIQLAGRVTDWNGANATGRMNAKVSITNSNTTIVPPGPYPNCVAQNTSDITVTWSPWIPPTASDTPVWMPWNFSFYSARIINTTSILLNDSGNDLTVSGLWNVVNITSSGGGNFTDWQQTESYVRSNSTGTFTVSGNWTTFTLSIAGFGDVSGPVMFARTNASRTLQGDIFGKGYVDIYDLVYVAKRMGETPGSPQCGGISGFEDVEKADVNGNFHQIDIYDLVTVATEIGQTG
jgi:hypothetical protein